MYSYLRNKLCGKRKRTMTQFDRVILRKYFNRLVDIKYAQLLKKKTPFDRDEARRACIRSTKKEHKKSMLVSKKIRASIHSWMRSKTLCYNIYTGCDQEVYRKNIVCQFEKGMTWENRGNGPLTWQIDHRFPICRGVDYHLNQNELKRVFHYTNTQPLWFCDHIKKGISLPKNYMYNQNTRRWVKVQ